MKMKKTNRKKILKYFLNFSIFILSILCFTIVATVITNASIIENGVTFDNNIQGNHDFDVYSTYKIEIECYYIAPTAYTLQNGAFDEVYVKTSYGNVKVTDFKYIQTILTTGEDIRAVYLRYANTQNSAVSVSWYNFTDFNVYTCKYIIENFTSVANDTKSMILPEQLANKFNPSCDTYSCQKKSDDNINYIFGGVINNWEKSHNWWRSGIIIKGIKVYLPKTQLNENRLYYGLDFSIMNIFRNSEGSNLVGECCYFSNNNNEYNYYNTPLIYINGTKYQRILMYDIYSNRNNLYMNYFYAHYYDNTFTDWALNASLSNCMYIYPTDFTIEKVPVMNGLNAYKNYLAIYKGTNNGLNYDYGQYYDENIEINYNDYYLNANGIKDIGKYIYNGIVFLIFEIPLLKNITSPLFLMMYNFVSVWQNLIAPIMEISIIGGILLFIFIYRLIEKLVGKSD